MDSLRVASEIDPSQGLTLGKNERGRDVIMRDARSFSTQPKAEFSDRDMRLSIMESQGGRHVGAIARQEFFPLVGWRRRNPWNTRAGSMTAWLKQSPNSHSAKAIDYLVAKFGAEHVLLESDDPYVRGDSVLAQSLHRSKIGAIDLTVLWEANA